MPDPTHPYDRPSDPAKRHSAALTDGPDRAGARCMLKADRVHRRGPRQAARRRRHDLDRDDAVQLSTSGGSPSTSRTGIRAAGGTPMEFNTISVSDGVSMGTEGMKASLISREVVADSIELVVRGHLLDGVVCLVGCDKTTPGAAMALGRLDVPGLVLYNGTIYPGTYKGQRNATVVTVYEAIGAYRAGKITLDELYEIENVACPGAGRLRRPVHGQHDEHGRWSSSGSRPAGLNGIPAEDPAKDEAARRSGELVMDLVRRDVRPSRVRHPRVARERDRLGRGDRRLDQRRPAPAGDRPRVRDPARHRRVRGHRRPDADRRRHAARRPLHRVRPVRRRRRRRSSCASCSSGRACSTATRRPSTAGRSPRSPRRPSRPPARRSSSRSRPRSSRPVAWRSSTARSRRTAASSSWPATSDG